MKKITNAVKEGKILVSDGAWGTFLQQKGLKPGESPELWNLTHRDEVKSIAKSYINAGADIIETNSFGGSTFKLNHFGLQDKTCELSKAAAEISREAAGDKIVMASAGPTGKFLMMGDITEDELYESFKLQTQGFVNGGADAVIIETFYDLGEAEQAIKAVKENSDLEIICSFTFENRSGQFKTMMGTSPAEAAKAALDFGADIVGTNCGFGFVPMVEIINQIRSVVDIPILVQANAGLPELDGQNIVYPETPKFVANVVPDLITAGANIIGGCCGTTPDHIKAIVKKVRSIKG
ncbi:MAG: homocysteine S-methyltransferase family protein [Melioribacteraceae bacterium]|nr:homocysteine S-methyltransferase family protein [Melioribacteraceae bacterium]MCF8353172.1 homocysteine S-methyltransferase family protein [Melioribacteraceae bacterium]MCF8395164.1 homocysteine S-methyltransferase family protein [Melioribacteraceae bacterium]MCF8418031.1 homocysteine S-methyltransferase family protein [Melioribacteraceae bacterium]